MIKQRSGTDRNEEKTSLYDCMRLLSAAPALGQLMVEATDDCLWQSRSPTVEAPRWGSWWSRQSMVELSELSCAGLGSAELSWAELG